MESKKIIPIIVAIAILVCGVFIYSKSHKKEEGYTKLIVMYNENETDYTNLKVGDIIKEIDAEIIATEGNKIVIRNYNGDDKEIKLNNSEKICKTDDDCATLTLE
ncbi:MAG: hypothetical protein ACI4XR_04615 [Bacilli bacterium]